MEELEKLIAEGAEPEVITKAVEVLSPEQLTDYKKKQLTEIMALHQEKKRNMEKNAGGKEDVSKFREEQLAKAKSKFYSEFPDISDEDKTKIEEEFLKSDSGKFDSDYIYGDILSAYVKTDPKKFIDAQKRADELERGAAEFNASQSGTHGGGSPSEDDKKFSPSAIALVKETRKAGMEISPEAAERTVNQGLTRTY